MNRWRAIATLLLEINLIRDGLCTMLQGRRSVRAAVGMGSKTGVERDGCARRWTICEASEAEAASVML